MTQGEEIIRNKRYAIFRVEPGKKQGMLLAFVNSPSEAEAVAEAERFFSIFKWKVNVVLATKAKLEKTRRTKFRPNSCAVWSKF